MKKYSIPLMLLLIYFLIKIALLIKVCFYPCYWFTFPCKNYDSLPFGIDLLTTLLVIFIYVGTSVYLYMHEKEIDKYYSYVKGIHLFWFFSTPLLARYKNEKGIVLLYSTMMTSFLFSFALPLTTFIIDLRLSDEPVLQNNPLSFVHSQGAIVSFIVICLSFYTFTNTRILRSVYEREIDSLEELFFYLKEKLCPQKEEEYWGMYSNIFYYVLDHTMATGHFSSKDGFVNYAISLRAFLKRKPVDFKGLVYTIEKHVEYMAPMLGKANPNEVTGLSKIEVEKKFETEIKTRSIVAQDVFLSYLNFEFRIDGEEDFDKIMQKIMYRPYRENEFSIPEEDRFFMNKLGMSLPKPADDQCVITAGFVEGSNVLQTDEIGLTRFIVTNKFVIQFIASKENGKRNVPTGYISEDITVIQRYKRAFEEYRQTHGK